MAKTKQPRNTPTMPTAPTAMPEDTKQELDKIGRNRTGQVISVGPVRIPKEATIKPIRRRRGQTRGATVEDGVSELGCTAVARVGRIGEWVGEVLERPTIEGLGAFEREGGGVIGREQRRCDGDGVEEDGDEDRQREGDWGHR
ncbi:hypothetical protein FH972_007917 [Carpinus fangiana]|uniref:Uncharacterized protein n=1 Tax=Carpinus fangiana TaxID=176857 RepID=A0A5N6R0F4_9ROSI|nr:hypothetical protein FH972_007917 [Carpinus fangiana]